MEANNNSSTEKQVLNTPHIIARFFCKLILYVNVTLIGRKKVNGYAYKKVGNSPLVGVHHFDGYELINSETNKVLYRRVKDYGVIGDRLGDYSPENYRVRSKFFFKNVL